MKPWIPSVLLMAEVGFIDPRDPRFVQTAGPDISDPANYRPIANGLTRTPNNILPSVCPTTVVIATK